MKRRSLLAVLCALVLVVVAVVLIGDNDRHGTEATEGKPFTGSSGVTRSVASIVALSSISSSFIAGADRRRFAGVRSAVRARDD